MSEPQFPYESFLASRHHGPIPVRRHEIIRDLLFFAVWYEMISPSGVKRLHPALSSLNRDSEFFIDDAATIIADTLTVPEIIDTIMSLPWSSNTIRDYFINHSIPVPPEDVPIPWAVWNRMVTRGIEHGGYWEFELFERIVAWSLSNDALDFFQDEYRRIVNTGTVAANRQAITSGVGEITRTNSKMQVLKIHGGIPEYARHHIAGFLRAPSNDDFLAIMVRIPREELYDIFKKYIRTEMDVPDEEIHWDTVRESFYIVYARHVQPYRKRIHERVKSGFLDAADPTSSQYLTAPPMSPGTVPSALLYGGALQVASATLPPEPTSSSFGKTRKPRMSKRAFIRAYTQKRGCSANYAAKKYSAACNA